MLNFIDMLTGNVPPHKPPRSAVRTVTMEGSWLSNHEKLKVAARLRVAEGFNNLGTEARTRIKGERKEALLAKLKEVGTVTAIKLAHDMKYSETNTRVLLLELVAESKVTKVKIGATWWFKAV